MSLDRYLQNDIMLEHKKLLTYVLESLNKFKELNVYFPKKGYRGIICTLPGTQYLLEGKIQEDLVRLKDKEYLVQFENPDYILQLTFGSLSIDTKLEIIDKKTKKIEYESDTNLHKIKENIRSYLNKGKEEIKPKEKIKPLALLSIFSLPLIETYTQQQVYA